MAKYWLPRGVAPAGSATAHRRVLFGASMRSPVRTTRPRSIPISSRRSSLSDFRHCRMSRIGSSTSWPSGPQWGKFQSRLWSPKPLEEYTRTDEAPSGCGRSSRSPGSEPVLLGAPTHLSVPGGRSALCAAVCRRVNSINAGHRWHLSNCGQRAWLTQRTPLGAAGGCALGSVELATDGHRVLVTDGFKSNRSCVALGAGVRVRRRPASQGCASRGRRRGYWVSARCRDPLERAGRPPLAS